MTQTNLPDNAQAKEPDGHKSSYLKGSLAGAGIGAVAVAGMELIGRARGFQPTRTSELTFFVVFTTAIGAVSGAAALLVQRRSSQEPQSHADKIKAEQAAQPTSPSR